MRRTIARQIEPVLRWLANAGLLNESSVCNLVDWTLRNESRYRRGSLGTAVKTTSILRDQHGRYAAIRHSSISKEADYATLWNPQDQTSTLGCINRNAANPAFLLTSYSTFLPWFCTSDDIVRHEKQTIVLNMSCVTGVLKCPSLC